MYGSYKFTRKVATMYIALIIVTLGLSVTLNTIFITTSLHMTIGAVWAISELAVFAFPRNYWSIPVKLFVQVLSFMFTFLFLISFLQSSADTHKATTTKQADMQERIETITARINDIKLNGYVSNDPDYAAKRTKLEQDIHNLKNTPFTYYKKTLPQSYWEAANYCNSQTTTKSAKVIRDYPTVCPAIHKAQDEIKLLDNANNSASAEASELRRLADERTKLIEDSPKLGQSNIKGLTDNLFNSLNLSGMGDNFLILLVGLVCLVITVVNTCFSMKVALSQPFNPKTMRTGSGLVGYKPKDVVDNLLIPSTITINTAADSKFAQVLAAVVVHHTPGAAINKETVKQHKKCSNDIAQAVIKTLAHNNLLEKDRQSWVWC